MAESLFAGNDLSTMVLGDPRRSLIGRGVVHAWAAVGLPRARAGGAGIALGPADDHPHAAVRSFAARRIGKLSNRAVPADKVALFSKPIRDFVEKVTALAHSAADPAAYATQFLARLCPVGPAV